KGIEFKAVDVKRKLLHIGVLTQPNFNIDTGLGCILEELSVYANRRKIRVSIRIHPRDFSDYSAYNELIDHTEDADDYLNTCDFVVVKRTSMIVAALRDVVPFVSFAVSEVSGISYMRFSKALVTNVNQLLEKSSSYSKFIINYKEIQ